MNEKFFTAVDDFTLVLDESKIRRRELPDFLPDGVRARIREIEVWRDADCGSETCRETAKREGVPLDKWYDDLIDDIIEGCSRCEDYGERYSGEAYHGDEDEEEDEEDVDD